MLMCFWVTLFIWDVATYLIIGDGSRPKKHAGSRTAHRRSDKHKRSHLRSSLQGFLPPLLRFLLLGWMIMSSTIQVPHDWYPGMGNVPVPGPTLQMAGFWTHQFVNGTSDRVLRLDDMVVLNVDTLAQCNRQRKFDSLIEGMHGIGMLRSSSIVDEVCSKSRRVRWG